MAFTLAGVAAAGVIVAFAAPIRRTKLDWFALGAGATGFAAMFVSPDFHLHYAYFAAAFMALLLGVCVDRVVRLAGSLGSARLGPAPRVTPAVAVIAIVVIGAGCVWGIGQETRFDRRNPEILTVGEVAPGVESVIPAGACTVADEVSRTLLTDRFVSHRSGCPTVVDTFSTWISYDPNTLPPSSGPYKPALVAAWRSWLASADYAVFSEGRPFRIPWSPDLEAWFEAHYRLVFESPGTYVFRNVSRRG